MHHFQRPGFGLYTKPEAKLGTEGYHEQNLLVVEDYTRFE